MGAFKKALWRYEGPPAPPPPFRANHFLEIHHPRFRKSDITVLPKLFGEYHYIASKKSNISVLPSPGGGITTDILMLEV